MKELKAFESWAKYITESNLFEKGIPNRVQVVENSTGDKTDRRLQQSDSILRQARRAFPGRDDSEAIALWTAGEVAKSREAELRQNKLINAQKRENEKLTRTVSEIGQEIDDFEKQSEKTDREVQRIKQLAGQTRREVVTRQVDRQEVEAMLNDLSKLKDRSDVSPEEYKKIRAEIDRLKGKTVDEEKFKEVQLALERGEIQAGDLNKLYDRIKAAGDDLDIKQASIEDYKKRTEKKLKDIADNQAREFEALEKTVLAKKNDVDKYVKKAIDRATGRKGSYVQSKNRLDKLEPAVANIEAETVKLTTLFNQLASEITALKSTQPGVTQPKVKQQKYTEVPTAKSELDKPKSKKSPKKANTSTRVVTYPPLPNRILASKLGGQWQQRHIGESYNDEDPQYAKLYSMWGKAQDLDEHFWDLLRAELGAKDFQKVTHVLRYRGYTPEQLEGAYTKAMLRVLRDVDGDVPNAIEVWKHMLADLQDDTPDVATAQRKGDEAIAKARRLPPKLSDEVDSLAESILGSSYSRFLK